MINMLSFEFGEDPRQYELSLIRPLDDTRQHSDPESGCVDCSTIGAEDLSETAYSDPVPIPDTPTTPLDEATQQTGETITPGDVSENTTMLDGAGPAARNMERAHTQRTVEVVVSRETIEPFWEECRERIPQLTADKIFMTDAPYPLLATAWVAAQRVSEILLNSGVAMPEAGIEKINDIMSPATYSNAALYSMREGVETQARFPLHLAHDISSAAQRQGVPGFATNTFGDIIRILKRPDFRAMVNDAAFTANTVWRDYSVSFHRKFRPPENGTDLGFTFDTDGNVDFTPAFKAQLRTRLADVNKAGRSASDNGVADATSSGCPARRLRPSFTGSERDRQNMLTLGAYFNISPEAVTAASNTTIINQGLDLLVEALEYVQPLVEAYIAEEVARRQRIAGNTTTA